MEVLLRLRLLNFRHVKAVYGSNLLLPTNHPNIGLLLEIAVSKQRPATLMPGPCSGKNLISILVTDFIQKRRGQALLFSFEYNLLPNLITNFNHYMDRANDPRLCCSFCIQVVSSKVQYFQKILLMSFFCNP